MRLLERKSSFGLGLRGDIAPNEVSLFWEYKPKFLNGLGSIFVLKDSLEGPLVFVIPNMRRPVERKESALLSHSSKSTRITDVVFAGPNYRWALDAMVDGVRFVDQPIHQLTVGIDGFLGRTVDLNRQLRLEPSKT